MYFTPYLVTVKQAEQYRDSEGWLTRPHGNSRRSDRRSIPIHECTREGLAERTWTLEEPGSVSFGSR